MITVEIQPQLEQDFKAIVQKCYNGDECAAINEAVKILIEIEKKRKMTWEERFDETLKSVRTHVNARGGISDDEIEQAIQRVRQRKRRRGEVRY